MKIFATLDIDNDGDVTEEEFVQGCLKDEELVIVNIILAINMITNIKSVTNIKINITIALESYKLSERRWRLSAKTRQGHHWLYPAKRPRPEGESQGICCNQHCHYHYHHHWKYLCSLCRSNTNFSLNLHLFALLSKKNPVVFQTLQKLHHCMDAKIAKPLISSSSSWCSSESRKWWLPTLSATPTRSSQRKIHKAQRQRENPRKIKSNRRKVQSGPHLRGAQKPVIKYFCAE